MRIAIFSDIHGNLDGLNACLADLNAQGGADVIVGAGDFCMDGAYPRQVLERLVEVGARCLLGNTDRYIASGAFGNKSPRAIAWQRRALGPQWIDWLNALPFSLQFGDGPDGLLVVHANPKSDDEHIWPDANDEQLERFTSGVVQRTIAFGHLHLPYVRVWRDRVFVNVASAGIPKDGDPRAGYAILTQRSGGWEIKHRRVFFDVEAVACAVRDSGMPFARAQELILRRHRYVEIGKVVP